MFSLTPGHSRLTSVAGDCTVALRAAVGRMAGVEYNSNKLLL